MEIQSVRRTRKKVTIRYRKADGEIHQLTHNEKPKPDFDLAIEALRPLIIGILGLPESYGEGLKPTGLTIAGEDKQVCLVAIKDIPDANGVFNIATPLRFLDHPATEGTFTQPLTEEQVKLVDAVCEQAEAYLTGDRMQGVLLSDIDQEAVGQQKAIENHDPLQDTMLGEGAAGQELSADDQAVSDASKAAAASVAPKKRGRKSKVKAEGVVTTN
jgi:hypothetical protein